MEVDEAMVDTILVVLVVVCIFWVESMQLWLSAFVCAYCIIEPIVWISSSVESDLG